MARLIFVIVVLLVSGCSNPTHLPPTQPIISHPTESSQKKYYVASNGDDLNPGSIELPWRTIGKVNQEMANIKPGDSVLFKRGDEWLLNKDGEAGLLAITSSGIIFGAYGDGNLPVFNGLYMKDEDSMWKGIIAISNVSHVTIENLDLYNAVKQQMLVGADNGRPHHITIQNCIFRTNRTQGYMLLYVQNNGDPGSTNNIVIRNNHFYDSKWNGMRITGGVNDVFINGNLIHDVDHNGIDTYPTKITTLISMYDSSEKS